MDDVSEFGTKIMKNYSNARGKSKSTKGFIISEPKDNEKNVSKTIGYKDGRKRKNHA